MRILVACHEDCGGCVQTTVNMARADGVPRATLRAILDGRPDDLSDELRDVYHFVDRVLRASHDEAAFRERILARYGARGEAVLSEIAIVLSATRVFPLTQRVLGYATSCTHVLVDVEGGAA